MCWVKGSILLKLERLIEENFKKSVWRFGWFGDLGIVVVNVVFGLVFEMEFG